MSRGKSSGGSVPPLTAGPTLNGPERIAAADLDDRQIRGVKIYEKMKRGKIRFAEFGANRIIIWSSNNANRAVEVTWDEVNVRGTMTVQYRSSSPDFIKNGRRDSKEIFAVRLWRKEVVIDGSIDITRSRHATAVRRPVRLQPTADGRSHRTVQRVARQNMPKRIPELVAMLKQAYDCSELGLTESARKGHASSARAMAMLFKIVNGLSADEMVSRYERLIDDGVLRMRRPPHPNTLSAWMNDPGTTPILQWLLAKSASPFRACENAAIVDSSKVSQLRNAHSRWVEYEGDERDSADWVKCHAIIGAETSVVMGVRFSGTRGTGTHDINFIKPLVEEAQRTFSIDHVLADKAYLSEEVVGWLWSRGIKAVIPVKKRWDAETKNQWYDACLHLVQWYDQRPRDFHEAFRFRVKIEALFSHLKRLADGYCWSRGRHNKVDNDREPCVAWINELLCKFIYINLRVTVTREEMTGYRMNYLADDVFFPRPTQRLIAA